ncbi:ATP-dependent DNA ligase [Jatrophihabitans sp. YIM 134969]
MTSLALLVETAGVVGATTKRLAKRAALADLVRRVDPADVATVVAWLSGDLRQRQIGVGWASLRTVPPAADSASLTVAAVDATFDRIKATTGAGSQARRADDLAALFAAATPREQAFLRALLGGELRQGALAGVMTDAVAAATDLPLADVRRAVMLRGDLPAVAAAAVSDGAAGLAGFRLEVGRPIAPMLAQPATECADALERLGPAAVEWKLDGARIQVHRDGDDVAVFTRSLDEITGRVPGVVAAARALPARSLVLDGESLMLRSDGSPAAFQDTASRFGRRGAGGGRDVAAVDGVEAPGGLQPFWFDLVHLDGTDLLDAPLRERVAALDALAPESQRVQRVVTDDPAVAQAFYDDTVAARHEGIVAKGLDSPYEAGRRGGAWLKVKPVHTLDLVVLGVEWGSGRRRGWLSNLHLGARADNGEGFVMLGKTFKGLTDATLQWQTERFLALATGPTDQYVVQVRPEQVVEIAFDGVQRSTRYPGGVALRFARVLRYRDDKTPAEADTLATVRAFGAAAADPGGG